MQQTLPRRRLAVFTLFFLPGLSIASWVSRTPDIRDSLGATTAQMGLVLFGLSVGSMIGILFSGALVTRHGAKRIILIGTVSIAIGIAIVGSGAAAGSAPLAALGLSLFGLGMGGGEVALNVEGAEVERGFGRSTLPAMHGFFSLGTVTGALIGMVSTARDFPVLFHLMAIVGLVLVGVVGWVPVGSPAAMR